MLASLPGLNFSLNSDKCFRAEYVCSRVLLRFDTILEGWKIFFVLFCSWAFSEGSDLSDLGLSSLILAPFGILASKSSFNVIWPPFRLMASDTGLAPRRAIPSQTGGFWLVTAQLWCTFSLELAKIPSFEVHLLCHQVVLKFACLHIGLNALCEKGKHIF